MPKMNNSDPSSVGADADMLRLATNAAEEAVTTHTVGVIAETAIGPSSMIGTGTAIEWHGRRMILTAEHVLGTAADSSSLHFLFRAPGSICREDVEQRQRGSRFFRTEQIPGMRINRLEALDVATIDMPMDLAERHPVSFYSLEESSATPAPGTVMMTIGFPAALGQPVYGEHLAASRAIAYERLQDCAGLLGFDPSEHIALTYTYGSEIPPEGIAPHGFSGAGVWFYEEQNSPIWTSSHVFAGMITSFLPRRRLLKGLRREVILQTLRSMLKP